MRDWAFVVAGAVAGFAVGIGLNSMLLVQRHTLIHPHTMPPLRQALLESALAIVGAFVGFVWSRRRPRV